MPQSGQATEARPSFVLADGVRQTPAAVRADRSPAWLQAILPAMTWRPAPIYGVALGVLSFFVLMQTFSSAPTEFLYFQF